jgi:hypothetical protein
MGYSWKNKKAANFGNSARSIAGARVTATETLSPIFRQKPGLAPDPSGRLNNPLTLMIESLTG